MTRCRWIDDQTAAGFPVGAAMAAVDVASSTYYDYRRRRDAGPSEAELAEDELVAVIREVHATHDGTYGAPRMTAELARRGHKVNHKRVERLMRLHGIVGVHKAPKVRTTLPADDAPPLPDLVGRRFAPGAPDVAWVGDITYIPTDEGWLYLSSVLDLGSRRLLGYSMDATMPTGLVLAALNMAVDVRGGAVAGVIFHSDRGAQYLAGDYQARCTQLQIRQSVGRVGTSADNAVAESFWASLKRELIDRHRWASRAQARRAIFAWINRYNRHRLHTSLAMVPPLEWEHAYAQQVAA